MPEIIYARNVALTSIWLGAVLVLLCDQSHPTRPVTHKFDLSSFFYEESHLRQSGMLLIPYQQKALFATCISRPNNKRKYIEEAH
jgi:hypothetical protein